MRFQWSVRAGDLLRLVSFKSRLFASAPPKTFALGGALSLMDEQVHTGRARARSLEQSANDNKWPLSLSLALSLAIDSTLDETQSRPPPPSISLRLARMGRSREQKQLD